MSRVGISSTEKREAPPLVGLLGIVLLPTLVFGWGMFASTLSDDPDQIDTLLGLVFGLALWLVGYGWLTYHFTPVPKDEDEDEPQPSRTVRVLALVTGSARWVARHLSNRGELRED